MAAVAQLMYPRVLAPLEARRRLARQSSLSDTQTTMLILDHDSPAPRPSPVTQRSMSAQDSAHRSGDKSKNHKSKKPSMHADVIDRLDFSGVGPSQSPVTLMSLTA